MIIPLFGCLFVKRLKLRGRNVHIILSVIDNRYAYVAHNRINKNGTYRSPKQIADAMGHDLGTHLKSYSRFNTKDLENAFDCAVERLDFSVN